MQLLCYYQSGTIEKTVAKNPTKKVKRDLPKVSDFSIETVKTERHDLCAACNRNFVISEIRVMHVEYSTDLTVENFSFGGKALWYHVPCFARLRSKV